MEQPERSAPTPEGKRRCGKTINLKHQIRKGGPETEAEAALAWDHDAAGGPRAPV